MNHITFQIPHYSSRFKIKKPDELVIFETISCYIDNYITMKHIVRNNNTLFIKLLPSKKQTIIKNQQEIIENLRLLNIYIEKII